MIKKTSVVVCILFVVIVIAISVKTANGNNDKMLKVESVPVHNSSGWGYEIMVDHKVFIHQPYIPAIAGRREFLTKEDAMKTAGMVIEKLISGQQPAITKNDLAALKISYQ
ncbi:MAG: DUF4907 domain-containing protein [Ginsengibacter sp.]